VAKEHIKRCSISLLIRKVKIKTMIKTSHPLGWLLSKNQKITRVGEDVEKSEPLYTMGRNIK